MASKIERPASGRPSPNTSGEKRLPLSSPRRPPVTNVMLMGQQLAQAFGAAQALIDRIPGDPDATIDELRRWYYTQHPAERDRLLWQRFTGAEQIYGRLEDAIRVAREALEVERLALVESQAERERLATRPLPATVAEEARRTRDDAVRRYQSVMVECQQRQSAITELERLLPTPEQILTPVTEVTARVLEAVVAIDREAFVRRLRESGEVEHLRSRFERLRAASTTHAAEIDKWNQQVGRPLRIPRVAFPWPPAPIWQALLDAPTDAPELLWEDDPTASRQQAPTP